MLKYEIDESLIDLIKAIGGEPAETAYRECGRETSENHRAGRPTALRVKGIMR